MLLCISFSKAAIANDSYGSASFVDLENLTSGIEFGSSDVKLLQITISGTVTDESGQPLPGASVVEKGTSNGTVTDFYGNYEITTDGNAVLVVSFLGYRTQEITVDNRREIDVILEENVSQLDDVVVVGYGTQRKKDITGSVSSVDSEEIQNIPITFANQALQGKAAGVQVTQNSAEPGGGVSIRIRGSNSINAGSEPLYVIDGFPSQNALNSINPNDIETIDILKDASATAIYGSRGANGVVIITTKRGAIGKPNINVNVFNGLQTARRTLDLLNATQYAILANEAQANSPNPQPPLYADPSSFGEGTDWQNETLRPGIVSNINLSVSGGNENTKYLVSADYFKEDGIVRGSAFERYSFSTKLGFKASEKLKFDVNLLLSRTDNDIVPREVVQSSILSLPTLDVFNEDGSFLIDNTPLIAQSRRDNPVALAETATNNEITSRVLASLQGEYAITDNLSFKTVFGIDNLDSKRGAFFPKETTIVGIELNSRASVDDLLSYSLLNENYLTYKKASENHSLNLMLGQSFQKFRTESFGITRSDFPTDANTYFDITAGQREENPRSAASESSLLSYFFRANYAYKDKYLFTGTIRADGSSRVGANNKFGYFPSGSVAWRVSEEEFLKNSNFIDDMKIRASYGVTGNQEIPPYRSLARIESTVAVIGGVQVVGFDFSSDLPNEDLRWESTAQFDVGLDLSILNNRVSLVADYFKKTTTDLLFRAPVPPETGFTGIWRNIGSVENEGFEFGIETQNISTENFTWSTNANVTFTKNEITELANDGEDIIVNGGPGFADTNILRVGEPIGAFFGYQFDGIWQLQSEIDQIGTMPNATPGEERYADTNNDGVINGDDRVVIGSPVPDAFFGFTNTFTYKNLELNVFFQGSIGNEILNVTRYILDDFSGITNPSTDALNRWTGPGTSNEFPKAVFGGNPQLLSDKWVEDGSYVRLRNITLAYNINLKNMQKFRVYLTGQNLVTFDNYSGYDPEVNFFGTSNNTSENNILKGIDLDSYPFQKRVLLGLNLSF